MPALHREATMLRLRAYDLIQNGCHKAVDSILQPSDPKLQNPVTSSLNAITFDLSCNEHRNRKSET